MTDVLQFFVDLLAHVRSKLQDLLEWNLSSSYVVLFLIVFYETGLVVTPFLPGDSLLFAVGALAAGMASGGPSVPLLLVLLIVAAVLGDAVIYAIGWLVGPKV